MSDEGEETGGLQKLRGEEGSRSEVIFECLGDGRWYLEVGSEKLE